MFSGSGRVLSIAKRLDEVRTLDASYRTTTPPAPRSAKLELTSRCDLHCYFCASHKRRHPEADMSPTLYVRIADELRMLGVEQLGLFYVGESMLCEWLPEAIRYAKSVCRFPYVFLTTNGLSATPERVRACIASGLDSLKFAFNWSDRNQFQRITGVPATEYDRAVENLKAARCVRDDVKHETGHHCSIYASSLKYDDEQPHRMRHIMREIQPCVDHHYWLPLIGHCGLPGRQLAGRPVPLKSVPCWGLFTEAHVTADGKLSACSLDASARFHMGDLNEDSFMDAWHSADFQTLRRRHLEGSAKGTACQSCIAY